MIIPFLFNAIFLWISALIPVEDPVINDILPVTTTVEQYGKFEVALELTASFDNPYDYDEVSVRGLFTAPNGEEVVVDGFYMEDFELDTITGGVSFPGGGGTFKVRFAPQQKGTWSYTISVTDEGGTATSGVQQFECVSGEDQGFIRSDLSNYLHFDDGQQYIPVGENIAWQNGNAFLDYQKWLTGLAENGGNFFRLWHAHWGLGIEWRNGWNGFSGLRRYKEINLAYQDWLFDLCAQKDIYVMVCLQHHGQVSSQVNPNWADNPYNTANGGPCQNTWDFFTNESARAHTRNRLRYVVARWGYSRNIMAWELFNEVGWTDNYDQVREEVTGWHTEMAAYLKSIDPYQHLVTTSFSDPADDPLVWMNPDIDLTQTHFYFNTPQIHNALVKNNRDYLKAFGKPTLSGEFGLGPYPELSNEDPDGIHIHNAMWAALFGGGLGTGMSWWWDSYIHPRDLYYHFAPMSAVAAAIPFLDKDLRPASAFVSDAAGDLLLTPTLDWAGIGTDTIIINENGSLTPADADLGKFLYGSLWNTEFRSPPTFIADFPAAGSFSVKTSTDAGNNPRIAILINGSKVLDQPASTNEVFIVEVPAGPATITVDNTGIDWITIASYEFSGLGSQVDAYVLASTQEAFAAGWVLNKAYNHIAVTGQGEPASVMGGILQVEDFANGAYTISWYDCLSGAFLSSEPVTAENNRLVIPLPDLYWDLAFTVEGDPLGVKRPDPAIAFKVYPNPVEAGSFLTVQYQGERLVDQTRLVLFNGAGKAISVAERKASDKQQQWTVPADLPAGMYWLQVRQGRKSGVRPLVVVKK